MLSLGLVLILWGLSQGLIDFEEIVPRWIQDAPKLALTFFYGWHIVPKRKWGWLSLGWLGRASKSLFDAYFSLEVPCHSHFLAKSDIGLLLDDIMVVRAPLGDIYMHFRTFLEWGALLDPCLSSLMPYCIFWNNTAWKWEWKREAGWN